MCATLLDISQWFSSLSDGLGSFFSFTGIAGFTYKHLVMILVGVTFIMLGVFKEYEPLLLIPIGFGIIIGNIPFKEGYQIGIYESGSVLNYLYFGVVKGFYPPLIGAAAQFGIFGAYMVALFSGFVPAEAGAIGIIGGADGPTAIFLSSQLAPHLMGAIAISAYSYMALVPIIQPPVMRLFTTKKERLIRMQMPRQVSKTEKVLFPIIGVLLTLLLVPSGMPLLGMLFFGNILKESGVTKRLADTAKGPLIDIVTMLLGLTVGASTQAVRMVDKYDAMGNLVGQVDRGFLQWDSVFVFVIGAFSFFLATATGVCFVKLMNLFLKKENRINPLIGNAGVSAVPDSARISQIVGLSYDKTNHLLMHAMAPNVAGVIGSAVAAGVLLSFLK